MIHQKRNPFMRFALFQPLPVVLLAAILGLCATSRAQTTATWVGPASGGEWNTPANWNPGVPGVGTNAVIGSGTNVNYNLPMTSASGFGQLTNKGVLNVNTNGFNN